MYRQQFIGKDNFPHTMLRWIIKVFYLFISVVIVTQFNNCDATLSAIVSDLIYFCWPTF